MDWIGLFHLFKLFLRYCYDPEDQNQDLFSHTYVPRPNDFSDFAEYFVRKVGSLSLPYVEHQSILCEYRAYFKQFHECASKTAGLLL